LETIFYKILQKSVFNRVQCSKQQPNRPQKTQGTFMGASQEMLKRIKEAKTKKRLPFDTAYTVAQELIKDLKLTTKSPFTIKPQQTFIKDCVFIGGSLRRKKETIGDIDLLCTYDTITEDQLRKTKRVNEIWGSHTNQLYFDYTSKSGIWRPINVWFCHEPQAFGSYLVHVTGSKKFNIMLRSKAKFKGMKMNQHGLFDAKTNEYITGACEQDVFDAVHEKWVEPWNREK
jgi:DNA polymerase/3'-5' exonuclease PolX